jgi:hypothetical protein
MRQKRTSAYRHCSLPWSGELRNRTNGHAWNNDVVVCCVVLSLLLFAKIDAKGKNAPFHIAAIGTLLTLATFMRSTTILAGLLFFVALLSLPAASVKDRIKRTFPFIIAAALVLIYPLIVVARASKEFSINLFKIHILNSQWLQQRAMVLDKLRLTVMSLTSLGYFMLFLIVVYLIIILVWNRKNVRISNGRSALCAASLTTIFFAIALGLPTIWRQYLAPPVPFLLCSFAYPMAYLNDLSSRNVSGSPIKVGVVLFGIGALTTCVLPPDTSPVWGTRVSTSEKLVTCFKLDKWIPMQVHRTATDIAGNTKEPKLILTLAPLFALEGGCDIYPELSAGAFTYRIGDLMSETDRRITQTAGPEQIPQLVEQCPPAAIMVGAEPPYFSGLEEPLEAVAGDNWGKKIYTNGLRVYFRP